MKILTKKEIQRLIPVVVSDLKHHDNEEGRVVSIKNIQKDLYRIIIRELFEKENFGITEGRDLLIKGYVRDVWQYLDDNYDLIHSAEISDYISKFVCLYEDENNK